MKIPSFSVMIVVMALLCSCNGGKQQSAPQPRQQSAQQSEQQPQPGLAEVVASIRDNTPMEMTPTLTWTDIAYDENSNEVTYTFEWAGEVDQMTAKALEAMKPFFIDILFGDPGNELRRLVEENSATVLVMFVLPDGSDLAKIVINSDDFRNLR